MMRALLIGLWGVCTALGATYGAAAWRAQEAAPATENAEHLDIRKIKPITVPIIANGVVKGYVSAEFSFVGAHDDKSHDAALDPESFFMDEAFRLIYGDSRIDFANVQRTDIDALTSQITSNVNQRMGRKVVKETLVRNLTFIAREELPR